MPVFTDQTGRSITLDQIPKRIVSLVPSQTELLADLGLSDEVVGITKFCVHPKAWFSTKPRIGGTKQVKIDLVHALQPDLIIASKEENIKEQVEELQRHYPTWVSDISNLADACTMIEQVAAINDKQKEGHVIVATIRQRFASLKPATPKPSTAYLIWRDPYMTVGGDTFIHSMLQHAGFENVFTGSMRYPEITISQLADRNIELLLLSSEPYPFGEKHRKELQQLLPHTRILLVDGELFSWYGSRLLHAPGYFANMLM